MAVVDKSVTHLSLVYSMRRQWSNLLHLRCSNLHCPLSTVGIRQHYSLTVSTKWIKFGKRRTPFAIVAIVSWDFSEEQIYRIAKKSSLAAKTQHHWNGWVNITASTPPRALATGERMHFKINFLGTHTPYMEDSKGPLLGPFHVLRTP